MDAPEMVLALLFSLTVVSAGFATLRALGLAKGAVGLGLAPPAGLAVLAIVSSWCMLLGAPPLVAGLVVFGIAAVGVGLALHDRRAIVIAAGMLAREHRLATATLLAGLAVPCVVMGFAFAGVQVPLSPHDSAFHVETIHAYRQGGSWTGWYPPGLAAVFAAWLAAFPWLDTAQGAFELGLSVPVLAALSEFGLGVALWRDLRMAAGGALLLGLTYLYPYFPELWGGWPLALSMVLLIGLWIVGYEYLNRPSARWGVVAGVMMGAIVLVHGSELYTLAIVFPVLLLGGLRRVHCRELWRDAGLAGVIGLAGAAPYLSTLLHWVGTGGAYSVGLQDEQVLQNSTAASASIGGAASTLVVFALNALGTDLPIRLVLGAIGVWWVFRTSTGRSVVVIGLIFTGLGLVLNLPNGLSAVHQVYALTFPWGMGYRLLMIMALAQALLAGAGGVVALTWLAGRARRPSAGGRRLGRVTRLGVGAWLGLTVWSTVLLLGYPAGKVLGYTADDAAAMAWLRDHALPGEVLANDGYADAGIWAPYKAGVPILLPRNASAEVHAQASVVIDNVDRLDQVPKARAVVCAMNIRYVYRGAKGSGWDARRFPSLDELRRSPALEEVFSSGAGVIFRIRQACL